MTYQVLARKWRPRRFDELVGQGHVVRALVNALDRDRLHHAFLFTGTRGVGKTTIARILAKSLNCEQGVTSHPCGTCKTCTEIDAGHFVDLIEVDAASRTKVDDTRELLDNVQYSPTRGRYKVYLIDEVHMLSGHSFNALLKTLEEPPPHVKFLLATTDPQKLPITVLSRCLQFNLKRLASEQIQVQLQKVLDAEQIVFERPSLALLAHAADGSMRDALSLLDQAIAYGGGKVGEAEVREMLGTIDQNVIERLLAGLATRDARALLNAVADVAEHNGDFDAVLKELLLALHRVSLAQVAPGALSETEMRDAASHAELLSPEDVQLCYQIGLIGRRDLALAPDARTGLEMTLLRMLAFKPAGDAEAEPRPRPVSRSRAAEAGPALQAKPAAVVNVQAVGGGDTGLDWRELIGDLRITGLVRELANNMTLSSHADDLLVLELDPACANLLSKERVDVLRQAVRARLGRDVRLEIQNGAPTIATPAKQRQREQDERQQAAIDAISNDPNVDALREHFNARVNLASIRPKA